MSLLAAWNHPIAVCKYPYVVTRWQEELHIACTTRHDTVQHVITSQHVKQGSHVPHVFPSNDKLEHSKDGAHIGDLVSVGHRHLLASDGLHLKVMTVPHDGHCGLCCCLPDVLGLLTCASRYGGHQALQQHTYLQHICILTSGKSSQRLKVASRPKDLKCVDRTVHDLYSSNMIAGTLHLTPG